MIIEHIPGKTNVANYLSRIPPFHPTIPSTTVSHALSLIVEPQSRDVVVQFCLDHGVGADVAVLALYSSLKSGTPVQALDCSYCSFCSFPHLDTDSHAIKKHKKHKCANCQQFFTSFFGASFLLVCDTESAKESDFK